MKYELDRLYREVISLVTPYNCYKGEFKIDCFGRDFNINIETDEKKINKLEIKLVEKKSNENN